MLQVIRAGRAAGRRKEREEESKVERNEERV